MSTYNWDRPPTFVERHGKKTIIPALVAFVGGMLIWSTVAPGSG